MLKPAILYKDQIESQFLELVYSDDYFYYNGYAHESELPKICLDTGLYQFAILDGDDVVGFISYRIDIPTDCIHRFGLISFRKENLVVVADALHELKRLIKNHRRIEWYCVSSNPASKLYDKICEHYNGNKLTLHQATCTPNGEIIDCYIYEILRDKAI
jgi:hypothetical protein